MFDFAALPRAVQDLLLIGSVGKIHLMHLAEAFLAAAENDGRPELVDTAACCMRAAWEADPLDGFVAERYAVMAGRRITPVPEEAPVLEQAVLLARSWNKPAEPKYMERLLHREEFDKAFDYAVQQLRKEPEVLYWLHQAVTAGLYVNDTTALMRLLDETEPAQAPEVWNKLRADVLFRGGDYEQAAAAYARAAGFLTASARGGEALYRMGRKEQGMGLQHHALQQAPWDVNLLHVVADRIRDWDTALMDPPGRIAVFLYTYNKAEELRATLDSLRKSRAGAHPDTVFFILNNGCSDDTAAVLDTAVEQFGPERLHVITMPVNIGAPAARNYLAAMPEVQNFDWIVYADDDALFPEDWQARLGAAALTYPEAGVWGCRVVDAADPGILQSVDFHLQVESEAVVGREDIHRRLFKLSGLQHQDFDFGQFSYMRPCASVTGCLHLFKRKVLQENGGFDVRFSPSQYDDLDHDLRLALNGRFPLYQGHLKIEHMKRTGGESRRERTGFSNAYANMYKLQMKYSKEQIKRILFGCRNVLLNETVHCADLIHAWKSW